MRSQIAISTMKIVAEIAGAVFDANNLQIANSRACSTKSNTNFAALLPNRPRWWVVSINTWNIFVCMHRSFLIWGGFRPENV